MKKTVKYLTLLICSLALAVVLQSCEDQGSAEKAGEKVDSVIEKTQESLEETGDKMNEVIEKGGEELEETGKKLQEQ